MPAIASVSMSKNLNIPFRRIQLTDLSQLPGNYSQTPGGTMFATTPGGTRIIYDRSELIKLRNSPVARTPPKGLPFIVGVTTSISPENVKELSPPDACAKLSPPTTKTSASNNKKNRNKSVSESQNKFEAEGKQLAIYLQALLNRIIIAISLK